MICQDRLGTDVSQENATSPMTVVSCFYAMLMLCYTGLHAIASKPGQSLAPMIGWFVLRSAGYTTQHEQQQPHIADGTLPPPPPLPGDAAAGGGGGGGGGAVGVTGEAAVGFGDGEGITGVGGGDVFDALLGLLIFLPGTVGLIQLVLWQAYGLHGAVLGTPNAFTLLRIA
jgi:hypothetical protein